MDLKFEVILFHINIVKFLVIEVGIKFIRNHIKNYGSILRKINFNIFLNQ